MNTNSNEKLPLFQYLGQTLRINFDETVKEVTSEDGETFTSYDYLTAVVGKSATLSERVEAIIRVKYPTYGAELAAKNGTVQDIYNLAYHVAYAKHLAKESLGYAVGEFNYVPQKITNRQAKQQLIIMGLFDDVEVAIESIVDPIQKNIVMIYWLDSQVFERDNAIMIQIGDMLGLTSEELDEAFKSAALL